jgi:hypothetical protein
VLRPEVLYSSGISDQILHAMAAVNVHLVEALSDDADGVGAARILTNLYTY